MKQFFTALLWLLAVAPAFAQSGSINGSTSLYKTPGGAVVASLVDKTLIEIGRREGGWYQVTLADGRRGYVPLRNVRFREEQASESVFGGLWSWLNSSRRSQDQMSTSTAGVRGFDEEELMAAQPDYAAVERLSGWAVGRTTATSFAAEGALRSRQVPELEAR